MELTETKHYEIKLELTTDNPIHTQAYRTDPKLREQVLTQIQQMLDVQIRTPHESPYVQYSIPRTEDIINMLRNSKYVSSIDMFSNFYAIPVCKQDREKLAFNIDSVGLYEYAHMLMGLATSPNYFQNFVDIMLRSSRCNTDVAYIDDIFIPGNTFTEHLENMEKVMEPIKKCNSAQQNIKILEHYIMPSGIQMDSVKIATIQQMVPSKNLKHLRTFLGLTFYLCRYIINYAQIMEPS
ncbi:hypothetical protein PR048_002757 [Dryococelus australis]|uniref:Reverse transcriptase domain-containing protein n=1 Tax=Dryococelus australis TaxID=614101 RepID=A0ABQ9IM58_9NEOP|nr:hypothetical protein PR048_002757 [Dryococelus australis]